MTNLTYSEWSSKEYLVPLEALIARFSGSAPGTDRLLSHIGRWFDGRPIFPVNRARTGLAIALAAFKAAQPGKDRVILPAYICPSVVETVNAVGLKPVAADVGADLNLDSDQTAQAFSPRTLAVIAAHMYGCPADIARLETLCRARGIFLVDDAAQLMSTGATERQLGTFGDAGIISFSQSKTIVTGSVNAGGLLIINNPQLVPVMSKIWAALPLGRFELSEMVRFVWNYRVMEAMPSLRSVAWRLERQREPDLVKESPQKMSDATALIALRQLESLAERIEGRKRVAEFYRRAIAASEDIEFPQYAAGRYLTRIALLVPPTVDALPVRDRLRSQGIQTRGSYEKFVDAEGHSGPHAADLARRLIEVPSHSRMTFAAVCKICTALREAISETAVFTKPRDMQVPVSA